MTGEDRKTKKKESYHVPCIVLKVCYVRVSFMCVPTVQIFDNKKFLNLFYINK